MKKQNGSKLGLSGRLLVERRNHWTGEVIDREEKNNLIVSSGKERVAKLLNGVSSTDFNYVAIGTGTDDPIVGDTALQTEVKRALADSGGTYEASFKAIWEKTFDFGSGETYNITEACISDSAVASGQTILNRIEFTAKAVDIDTDLYIKFSIAVS